MNTHRTVLMRIVLILGCLLLTVVNLYAQEVGYERLLGIRRGGELTFEPRGPGILFGALDPAVKKWYVPQELFNLYQWKQWEYTNYAKDHYQKYTEIALEGNYWYDIYGNFVTRGWLVYDWKQDQPRQFGSSLYKDGRYAGFFDQVLIASDSKGEYHSAVTIGDYIRTTLTPFSFSKPRYNGIQWDFLSDKYAMTALISRPSDPAVGSTGGIPFERTDNTNLFGWRGTAQLGDFVTIGATYVNIHQTQTLLEGFKGNPRKGSLTTNQNAEKITKIIVRLSDDSPEDNEGGAALYSENIVIRDTKGKIYKGSDIGFHPITEGGFQRAGFIAADGDEKIVMTYDFSSSNPNYNGPDPALIDKVTFELIMANDFRVEVTSDRQTNASRQPVFLLVTRAPGNVKDNSNQKIVRFDYGLPTANEIYGVTVEVKSVMGFDVYGEIDFNRQYRQYPNVNIEDHATASDKATVWMLNVSKLAYPWFAFGEAYSVDDNYSTTSFICNTDGSIDYENKIANLYELAEDNDDQDDTPDWLRRNQAGPDQEVFPGWDENNDFISDFNQNDNSQIAPNLIPDYEEPFLRYGTDRPEFLFGIDINNNGWVDRFENDELADYPYKENHKGYNVYFGVHLDPDTRLTFGQIRESLLAEKHSNLTNYLLFTLDKDIAKIGRLRIFDNVKLAKDDIPDNLFQWVQPPNSRGQQQRIQDALAAQDTWINTAFVGFDYTGIRDLNIFNKIKYDIWKQRTERSTLVNYARFLGIINKADYTFRVPGSLPFLGNMQIQPKIKNEFRLDTPVQKADPGRKENTLMLFLISKFPILRKSQIQLGLEYTIFSQLRKDISATLTPAPPGAVYALPVSRSASDFKGLVVAGQLTNNVDYLGYRLITQIGIRLDRRVFEQETKTTTTTFATVYAGAQR